MLRLTNFHKAFIFYVRGTKKMNLNTVISLITLGVVVFGFRKINNLIKEIKMHNQQKIDAITANLKARNDDTTILDIIAKEKEQVKEAVASNSVDTTALETELKRQAVKDERVAELVKLILDDSGEQTPPINPGEETETGSEETETGSTETGSETSGETGAETGAEETKPETGGETSGESSETTSEETAPGDQTGTENASSESVENAESSPSNESAERQ